MAAANLDEVNKCKQIAQTAMSSGDFEKAQRFLQKAKRMCPSDTTVDTLLEQAQNRTSPGGGTSSPNGQSQDSQPRFRQASSSASAPDGGARTNKKGGTYTGEQMKEVQRVLRTKDYYDVLGISRSNCSEDAIKKAYRKLALKLHPDKNNAPGADEAFKKASQAAGCLTNPEKKNIYDQYGDEERIPEHYRQTYHQDFMTPEDLFAAFMGDRRPRRGGDDDAPGGGQRLQLFQLIPVLGFLLLMALSNYSPRNSAHQFSFERNQVYHNVRTTATLNIQYHVSDDFDDHYSEGTLQMAEFEQRVELFHISKLQSKCNYEMMVTGEGKKACKDLHKVKRHHPELYQMARRY